jgi:hypothetical protein
MSLCRPRRVDDHKLQSNQSAGSRADDHMEAFPFGKLCHRISLIDGKSTMDAKKIPLVISYVADSNAGCAWVPGNSPGTDAATGCAGSR